MSILPLALACVLGIVVAAFVALVFVLTRPPRSKSKPGRNESTGQIVRPAHRAWKAWLLPLGIALIICIWSVALAIFFLAVVWVMRLNPQADSKEMSFPSDKDKQRAKGTYTWLLLSPFPNIIIFVIAVVNLSSRSSANERVVAALIPLCIHLPVLFRLDSKSAFVFRHTQQAVFLLALRASTAALALNIDTSPGNGTWLFLLANGFLWLFGTSWGRGQAHRGECWWINRKGEMILPRAESGPSQEMTGAEGFSSNENIQMSRKCIQQFKKTEAKAHALAAFRSGDQAIRLEAIRLLEVLDEVEKF